METPSKARVTTTVILLSMAIIIGFFLVRFLRVDACLDSGGAWDHGRGECTSMGND